MPWPVDLAWAMTAPWMSVDAHPSEVGYPRPVGRPRIQSAVDPPHADARPRCPLASPTICRRPSAYCCHISTRAQPTHEGAGGRLANGPGGTTATSGRSGGPITPLTPVVNERSPTQRRLDLIRASPAGISRASQVPAPFCPAFRSLVELVSPEPQSASLSPGLHVESGRHSPGPRRGTILENSRTAPPRYSSVKRCPPT